MLEQNKASAEIAEQSRERGPYRIRLPGFVLDQAEVGLGDVIKRATYRVGIHPCMGCGRRAARLNKWVVFTR